MVRLRVSNAMKRVAKVDKSILIPYLPRFLDEISQINQASTQWTLSQLYDTFAKDMTDGQRAQAQELMQHNLATHTDWIVLNTTMDTLGKWAKKDAQLQSWLLPHLDRLAQDTRKSVAKKAGKWREKLST